MYEDDDSEGSNVEPVVDTEEDAVELDRAREGSRGVEAAAKWHG